jgi:hypothetical protein
MTIEILYADPFNSEDDENGVEYPIDFRESDDYTYDVVKHYTDKGYTQNGAVYRSDLDAYIHSADAVVEAWRADCSVILFVTFDDDEVMIFRK